MEQVFEHAQREALRLTQQYGYGAVLPALLIDPAGVPWVWVFLMLLAGESGKSIPLMLGFGFAALTAFDYACYWAGLRGGRPLIAKIKARSPELAAQIEGAQNVVRQRGGPVVVCGRFLPLVGRFIGVGAGLANVPLARFAFFDALGVGIIVIGFGLCAHLVGRKTIDAPWFKYAIGVGMAAVVVSIAVALIGFGVLVWRAWKRKPAPLSPETAPEIADG